MKLNFDLTQVTVVEFGVGRENHGEPIFVQIPVDAGVKEALQSMVEATWTAMEEQLEPPSRYEPSEKHGGIEYLYLPFTDDMAAGVRPLHAAENMELSADTLAEPATVFCYFARLLDRKQRRLTALRRASQFKGVLKSRLVRFVTDAMKLVPDNVFKLDNDFDLLVDSQHVHILRPSGFEFTGKLQDAILAAVDTNIQALQTQLPFVNLASVAGYAAEHTRAARYLASILSSREAQRVDRKALKRLCEKTGVEVRESKGKIVIRGGHVLGFLEVLDRRRYELELVRGAPERFKAASRKKIVTST